MDWIAELDQTSAALGRQADLLKAFKEALLSRGFTEADTQELLVIWYDQALSTAAIRMMGDK